MGPRKNDMEKDPHVLDGDFGGFQNGASYVDLQVFYAHQLDFTTGKKCAHFLHHEENRETFGLFCNVLFDLKVHPNFTLRCQEIF
eukprot:03333.XXX_30252_22491_1 [CDS] Oithona nana genome sequencing.